MKHCKALIALIALGELGKRDLYLPKRGGLAAAVAVLLNADAKEDVLWYKWCK